jgi:hypothetical protein
MGVTGEAAGEPVARHGRAMDAFGDVVAAATST